MDLKPKFVITGLPRSRTAWLAALLSTPKVPVYHDVLTYPPGDAAPVYGVSDPCVALFDHLHHVADDVPTAIVLRGADDALKAAIAEFGDSAIKAFWPKYLESFYRFAARRAGKPTALVNFDALDDFDVVQVLHQFLTGRDLDRPRFDIFSRLRITEDIPKAQRVSDPQLRVVH